MYKIPFECGMCMCLIPLTHDLFDLPLLCQQAAMVNVD